MIAETFGSSHVPFVYMDHKLGNGTGPRDAKHPKHEQPTSSQVNTAPAFASSFVYFLSVAMIFLRGKHA
ncbi:hypothetical protein, partial [Acinetobacter baumannii]|uniref:hypothetical protein n=1 Tax=Acinetobacter baumannii TaxID=470 RepID=UPI00197AD8A4